MNSRMLAGASKVDITPEMGTQLAGDPHGYRPAAVVVDPLYARALVLKSGDSKNCIVTLDVTFITEEHSSKIRKAAEKYGIEYDAVMVHALQNHNAPMVGGTVIDKDFPNPPKEFDWSDEKYAQKVIESAVDAIGEANGAMRPVKIAPGSGIEGRLAGNRRGVMRDGKVQMPWPTWWRSPVGNTNFRYLEGPIDPEVGVVTFRDDDLKPVAMFLHYTCHPVHMFTGPVGVVSADWPGAWVNHMNNLYGDGFVPMVLNGCCGNINPWNAFDPDYTEDHRRMGRMLGEMAEKVVKHSPYSDSSVLDWRVRHIRVPIREVEPDILAEAQKLLEEHPTPIWLNEKSIDSNWMRAVQLVSADLFRKREGKVICEVQAFRIGDMSVVGLPGEPFVEGQLEIKAGSPSYYTFVAHGCNNIVGYIPTKTAFKAGGHEVDISSWSKLAPETLDTLVENALEMLREMF